VTFCCSAALEFITQWNWGFRISRHFFILWMQANRIYCGCNGEGQLKCDDTRAETRLCLSVKKTSPFKSAGASVQSTTGSRGVRISGSKAGHTMLRGSVKSTGYPLHSPVSPSLPLPCVTVCHHISTGVYQRKSKDDVKFKALCLRIPFPHKFKLQYSYINTNIMPVK